MSVVVRGPVVTSSEPRRDGGDPAPLVRRVEPRRPLGRRLGYLALGAVVQAPMAVVLAAVLHLPAAAGVACLLAFGLAVSYPGLRRGAVPALVTSLAVAGAFAFVAYAAGMGALG